MIQTLGKSRSSWGNLYFLKSLQRKTWQESPIDTILKTAGRFKECSQDPRIVMLIICCYFVSFIISIFYVSTETLLLVLNVLKVWLTKLDISAMASDMKICSKRLMVWIHILLWSCSVLQIPRNTYLEKVCRTGLMEVSVIHSGFNTYKSVKNCPKGREGCSVRA